VENSQISTVCSSLLLQKVIALSTHARVYKRHGKNVALALSESSISHSFGGAIHYTAEKLKRDNQNTAEALFFY